MCPHFEKRNRKCGLCSQDEWANVCMGMDVDFMVEEFCKTEAHTDDTGFKDCGLYKSKKGV